MYCKSMHAFLNFSTCLWCSVFQIEKEQFLCRCKVLVLVFTFDLHEHIEFEQAFFKYFFLVNDVD